MNPFNFNEKLDSVPDEVVADFKAKRYDKCLAACMQILSKNPTNKIALIYSGIINQEKDQDEKAIEFFNIITQAMPLFRHIWHYQGISFLKLKRYREARESFKTSVALYKADASEWSYLALAFYMENTKESKKAAFRILDAGFEIIEDAAEKGKLHLAKGILQQSDGQNLDALMSYMQSQILAPDSEKFVSAQQIGKLIK